jgi:hypothetical protein
MLARQDIFPHQFADLEQSICILFLFHAFCSQGKKQAAECPLLIRVSSGSSEKHFACAREQRSAKEQPLVRSQNSGTRPGIVDNLLFLGFSG